ncbi:MAG: hypothetical protein RLW87_07940 [Alphaproteobacteria bacterium]
MQWTFPHRIDYSGDAASIDDVIANLKAQQRLLEEGARFVCAAIDGVHVESIDIKVVRIASGSLLTEFVVQVYGAYQTQIEGHIVGGIEETLGVDIPAEWEPLVALGAMAATYFVARFAYDAVRRKKDDRPASTHIEGNYNTVINNIASRINVDAERLEGLLEGQLPRAKRRGLVKSVTGLLEPVRRNPKSTAIIDGVGEIPSGVVAEYPSDAELSEIDDRNNVDLPGAIVEIRATDKDNSKHGWAAKILNDGRFRRRLPMDLYPTVDADALAHFDQVTADVIVEGATGEDGSFRAKRIHLLNFRDIECDDAQEGT